MTLLHQAAQKAVEAKQREAFEHWYSDAGRWPKSVARGEDGHYLLAQTNSSYEAWRFAVAALQQQPEPVALAQDHPAPGWYWISVEGAEPVPARIWREFDSLPDSRLLFVPFGTFAPNDPRDWRHERECRAPEERNAALCIVAPIPLYAAPPTLQHQKEPSTAVIPPAPPEYETEDEKTAFAVQRTSLRRQHRVLA